MAVTIASNLVIFSDGTGHGNQSHLVYAANQKRWWLFNLNTKTATVVSCYVSSSADLTTATWAAGPNSPAFPSSHALVNTSQRCLAVLGFANGSTDVVHLAIDLGDVTANTSHNEHIRATFVGAASISWELWSELAVSQGSADTPIKGNALGLSTTNVVHETCLGLAINFSSGRPQSRLATNADTSWTWANAFGATAAPDGQANFIASYALAPLASAGMLLVYGNGGAAQPNQTGLRYNVYVSGATWPTAGSADVGFTGSQDQNDWCLIGVDTTHTYIIRRSGSNTFDWRKYDGSTISTPSNAVPNQTHLAGSGLFACLDGLGNFYLFALDTSNQLSYVMCTGANGASPSWGSWTTLGSSSVSARNYVNGYSVAGNSQIGVIYTQANGSNFDINVEPLVLTAPAAQAYCHLATTLGWVF